MSDLPYTDEQVEAVMACYRKAFCLNIGVHDPDDTYYRDETRDLLAAMREAGITVTFPKPRYFVADGGIFYHVEDEGWRQMASFHKENHPDARSRAEAEADRLSREAQP